MAAWQLCLNVTSETVFDVSLVFKEFGANKFSFASIFTNVAFSQQKFAKITPIQTVITCSVLTVGKLDVKLVVSSHFLYAIILSTVWQDFTCPK